MTTQSRGAADRVIAIIPARGGSKGLPGKNVRMIGGMPLIAHSVRHAIDSVVCVRRFTANLWRRTVDGEILALSEGGEARDAVYFQEMVGLALAARPSLFESGRRLGDAVGFEVVDQTWALVDVRDDTGFAVAEALADRLPQLEEASA